DDQHISFSHPVEVVVLSMGRVGTATYDVVRERFGDRVIGLDLDPEVVQRHIERGRQVTCGDATDPDFYARFNPTSSCRMVIIALQSTSETITIASLLRSTGFSGRIAAMAEFHDQVEQLREAGVDSAHYLHDELGIGLARTSLDELDTEANVHQQQ
ncbi:MAG: NAD(P)-binding protein, partial [Planctomycetota bacterium]